MKFAFFGTDEFSIEVLETFKKNGLFPSVIITVPDQPQGRKLILTPPLAKTWARENSINYLQPVSLKKLDLANEPLLQNLDLSIVASYGKIIPQSILDLPRHGTLNIHPSLLPKYRGSTPIESAILEGETETGVTVMLVDAEMDHGPIIAQQKIILTGEETAPILAKNLAQKGANLVVQILPDWLAGKITAIDQEHDKATYTKKIEKKDGQIDLNSPAEKNYRLYRAYQPWPGIYTTVKSHDREIRLNIKKAHLDNGVFVIDRITPEGKKEMSWEDFQRGIK